MSSFCSWKPQPGASNINAFSLNWSTFFGYAFPPFSLILKCLEKIRREQACVCFVCQIWSTQPWSNSFRAVVRHSSPSSINSGSSKVSTRSTSSSVSQQQSSVSRLDLIRNSLALQDLPSNVVQLLLAGCRPNTDAAYESAWRNWSTWCVGRSCNPLSSSLNPVLEFLTSLFSSGKSYSTINVHHSMLSKTLGAVDGHNVGTHPLVIKLLRGCCNRNPRAPNTLLLGILQWSFLTSPP
jgi:hypothetical protein